MLSLLPPADSALLKPLSSRLRQEIRLLNIDSIQDNIIPNTALFLFDHFRIHKRFVSFTLSWYHYLLAASPQCRFIVVGFLNYKDPNYIDLLCPPQSVKEFVETAPQVSRMNLPPVDGLDVHRLLCQLMDGHNKANGPVEKLNAVAQAVNTAEAVLFQYEMSMVEVKKEIFEPLLFPQLPELLSRWRMMQEYLKFLPYRTKMEQHYFQIEAMIDFLKRCDYTREALLEQSYGRMLMGVIRSVKRIDREYIRIQTNE